MPENRREAHSRPKTPSEPRVASRRRSAILTLMLVPAAFVLTALAVSDLPRMGRMAARVDLARLNAEFLGDDAVVFQSALNDCGPAALANMMRVVGVLAPPTDSLAVLAEMGPRGTTARGLIHAAGRFGLPLELVRLTPVDLRQARMPFIAWVNRNHFVTVTERAPSGRLTVVDPTAGRYSISEEAFQEIWSGESIVLAGWSLGPAAARGVAASFTIAEGGGR